MNLCCLIPASLGINTKIHLLLNILPSTYTITANSLRAWLQFAELATKNNAVDQVSFILMI